MSRPGYVRTSASQSFTETEVDFLEALFRILQRGGDPRVLVRRQEFGSLRRKVIKMHERVQELREQKCEPEQSSDA